MTEREKARKPEDLTRLFVERANARDAEGLALLYEENAVMAYPPGQQTVGRAAIQSGPTWRRRVWCIEVARRTGHDLDCGTWARHQRARAAAFTADPRRPWAAAPTPQRT